MSTIVSLCFASLGYAVLTKGHARGLTDSWNRGYELACKMGYKYIIYTNNDVLVSDWTVRGLTNILREEVLAVPMSTSRGAGHNPTQVICKTLQIILRA